MYTVSVVCARGAGARLLRCSGVPAVASVSPVWPRWRVDTGLHTAGIWRPAARPATSVISSLSRSHTVNRRCGAGHGVCSYRDAVTSLSLFALLYHVELGTLVRLVLLRQVSLLHCRETLVLEPHNHIFTCIWGQNTIESRLRYN